MPAVDVSAGASGVTVTKADLNGTLGTSAVPANVVLYWGTNTAAWSFTNNLGVRNPGSVTTHVTGLQPNSFYYYTFQATNSDFPAGPWTVPLRSQTLIDVTAWTRRMKIGFTGYTRGETLTNLPLSVVLNQTLPGFQYSSFSSTNNGYDLRFYNSAFTKELNYEIEGTWNPSTNTFAWVQVDKLASSNDFHLGLLRRNPAATNGPAVYTTNGATWTTNYVGVWHMNQTNALDSTANHFNGTAVGAVTQAVNSVVGRANAVTGNNYINVPYNAAFALPGDYSVGTWLWLNSASVQGVLGTYSAGFILGINGTTLQFYDGNGWRDSTVAASSLTNAWQYVVYTRSGSTNRFFINGSNVTTLATGAAATGGGNLTFGRANSWGNSYTNYNGPIDETRIATMALSTNWVWAEYLDMASNLTFQTNSTVESVGIPAITNVGTGIVTTNYADMVGSLSSTGIAATTVYCVYGLSNSFPSSAVTSPPVSWTAMGLVTNSVSGLVPDSNYAFTFMASNLAGLGLAPTTNYFRTFGVPTITNRPTIGLTSSGATLLGYLVSTGGSPTTVYSFWGQNPTAWTYTSNFPATSLGEVTNVVTGLNGGTTYSNTFMASNQWGVSWAPTTNGFTTSGGVAIGAPLSAVAVGAFGATLTAQLTDNAGGPTRCSAGGAQTVRFCRATWISVCGRLAE